MPIDLKKKAKESGSENISDYRQRQIDVMNELPGTLEGYDCPICKNKGVIYTLEDGYECYRRCECMEIRDSIMRLKASGLEKMMEQNRLDNFVCRHPWQENMKNKASDFLERESDSWFFVGGQPGIGKTHICTALAAGFLRKGQAVRYMLWKDESTKIKALVNDQTYERIINPWKECTVLYIDDLFKTTMDEVTHKRKLPSDGDIKLAFEIINYRYNNHLKTIISSEHNIDDMLSFDEALGSRIYERTKNYCISFSPDQKKNYRLYGKE